jgi:hypothetical protein
MDSLKLQLYLRARERIQRKENVFCCMALEKALLEFGFIAKDFNIPIPTEFLQEFFPEFCCLHDGSYWERDGRHDTHCPEGSAWWEYPWREPRLRALDIAISRAGG